MQNNLMQNIQLPRDLPTMWRRHTSMRIIFWGFSLLTSCLTSGAASDCSGVTNLACSEHIEDNPICRGSLVLLSPQNQTETFIYDKNGLNCEPENLQKKFKFSSVQVNGCGKFSIHSMANGRGRTILVSDSSGFISAQEQFTKVKSIKRLGCPKEGVAPYVIIAAICGVALVVIGVGIFIKKRNIYTNVSSRDCEHATEETNK